MHIEAECEPSLQAKEKVACMDVHLSVRMASDGVIDE